MKKIYLAGKLAAVLSAVVLGLGCVNVEYVGQSLPPLPADAPIAVFTPDSKMPSGKYRPIGWAYLTAPEGRSKSTVFDSLSDTAREHGADAVNIISFKNVQIGFGADGDSFSGEPSWNNSGRDAAGELIYFDSFGERAEVSKPEKFTEQRVKAMILVDVDRYNRMREEFLKKHPQKEKAVLPADASGQRESVVEKSTAAAQETIQLKKKPTKTADPVRIKLSDDREPPTVL